MPTAISIIKIYNLCLHSVIKYLMNWLCCKILCISNDVFDFTKKPFHYCNAKSKNWCNFRWFFIQCKNIMKFLKLLLCYFCWKQFLVLYFNWHPVCLHRKISHFDEFKLRSNEKLLFSISIQYIFCGNIFYFEDISSTKLNDC